MTRLRADGRAFRTADGSRFSWRGLTAFRLVEIVAHGRTADAIAVRAVPRRAGEPGAVVVSFDTARAEDLFLAQGDGREWAVAVGVKEDPALRWRAGWRVVSTKRYPGVVVIAARK